MATLPKFGPKTLMTQKGLTLIELLVASMLCTIILLAISVLSSSMYGLYSQGEIKLELQREADYAMETIETKRKKVGAELLPCGILEGSSVEVYNAGAGIKITFLDGRETYFYLDDTKLKFRYGEEVPIAIIPSSYIDYHVEELEFTGLDAGKGVKIKLTLENSDGQTVTFRSTAYCRN